MVIDKNLWNNVFKSKEIVRPAGFRISFYKNTGFLRGFVYN